MRFGPECCGHGRTWDQDCPACEIERLLDLLLRARNALVVRSLDTRQLIDEINAALRCGFR